MVLGTALSNGPSTGHINRRLFRGSLVLLGLGGVVWIAGTAMGAATVLAACRSYVSELEEAPSQIARRRLAQLRVATAAGAGAWQGYEVRAAPAPSRSRSVSQGVS